jgi:hypothetical protein
MCYMSIKGQEFNIQSFKDPLCMIISANTSCDDIVMKQERVNFTHY